MQEEDVKQVNNVVAYTSSHGYKEQTCSVVLQQMSRRQTCMKFIFLLSILPILCFLTDSTSASANTLRQGDTLKFNETISSSNFQYFLRFSPLGGTTKKKYLIINHPTVHYWIANRDNPILDDSGVLTIDNNGTFMISRSARSPIVLYSDDGAAGSTRVATLQDNGNLVFSELNSDGSAKKILWQSFLSPIDSLFPGMALGKVGDERAPVLSLTSWLTSTDPSSGAFTLDWDPMEHQMVVRRRGIIVWTSGVFKDGFFLNIPRDYFQDFTPVLSADGNSFSFWANGITYWRLYEEGTLEFQIENVAGENIYTLPLSIMEMCYGYNNDNGCVQWLQPKCRSDMQTFKSETGFFQRLDSNEIDVGVQYGNASVGPGDCRAICWDDCDCLAYVEADHTGCQFWRGNPNFTFVHDDEASSLYVITTTPTSSQVPTLAPQPSYEGHLKRGNINIKPGWRRWIWIGIVLLASLVCLILTISMYWWRWKRKVNWDGSQTKTRSVERDELQNSPRVFKFQCLSEVTNKFCVENKLGQGGFGPVYKGTLPEGNEIAVKRLSRSSEQGLKELKNELKLIAKLQHVNLVHLLGYCIEGDEKMLVYEYMPNKSLDSILFDPTKRCYLDCTTRLKIIEGIAQGLLYLHEHSRLTIIHRDLKPSNILLDASFNPKISDFGMARICKRNELMANTQRIVGTYGYMSPEYAMEGIFSVKSDVFSFGILILEIVSGRRNNSFRDSNQHINLIGYAWELWQNEAWTELVDPTLKASCSMSQMRRIIHVSLLCVEESALNRPTVLEVISILANENIPLASVKKPAFLILNITLKKEHHSISCLSLSSITAR